MRSRDMLNFYFLEKGLEIVSLPHFVYAFSRKMFLMLNSIKVACRVQLWKKKHFLKIVLSLVTVLFKMTLYLFIYFVFAKKPLF